MARTLRSYQYSVARICYYLPNLPKPNILATIQGPHPVVYFGRPMLHGFSYSNLIMKSPNKFVFYEKWFDISSIAKYNSTMNSRFHLVKCAK
ncbi:hypothetical protein F4212_10965 [Candidatus Poribacteria bacterium]|nr:hypothetical protein [Candidatus Poribacteria bacterium]